MVPGRYADVNSTCKYSVKCLKDVAEFLQPDCLQGCYKSTAHQYNETYFSAVEEDPKKYILARFALPRHCMMQQPGTHMQLQVALVNNI